MRPRTRLASLAAAVGAAAVVATQSMTGALAHGDGATITGTRHPSTTSS